MRYGRRYGYSFPARNSAPATAPANTALPVITQTGSVISVTTGTWTGTAPISFTYQLSRNGTAVSVPSSTATYNIPDADLGANFGCIVTATNAAGNASATAATIYVGLLDVLSVPASFASGPRRLNRAHLGPAYRVRRSDNAEQDIGFATAIQTRTNLDPVPAADGDSRTSAGITRTVVGTGAEFGQSYIDIRWNGTATAAVNLRYCPTPLTATPNSTTNALVTPGQTYTSSMGYRLVAGTWPAGLTARMTQFFRNGTALVNEANNALPSNPSAVLQRSAVIGVAGAATNHVQNIFQADGAINLVVDFTMRFYAPNTELGTGNARPLLQRNTPEVIADVGQLDAVAMLNFAGSSSAFVPIEYDQSGNGRDEIQATPLNQPRIVNAGAMQTENGRPTVFFNGSATVTSASSFSAAHFVAVHAWTGAVPFPSDYNGLTGFLGASSLLYLQPGSSTNFGSILNGAVRVNGSTTPVPAVNLKVTSSQGTVAYTGPYSIGQGDLGGPRQWTGPISEALYFNPALSNTKRQIVERNLGAYYGIPIA